LVLTGSHLCGTSTHLEHSDAMTTSNATTEFAISIGSVQFNLATSHCSGHEATSGPGHVMRLTTLSEGEAVIELNGFVGTLTVKSRNEVSMDEDAAATENHRRVDQSATAALHRLLGVQATPVTTDALLAGNTLNSTTIGNLSALSNLTEEQDSHPSHNDAEHYLEQLIREFLIASGGSSTVRNVGRYLLTCSDSQNSNRRSAHEEMKVLFVPLQKFLTLRPEIFHVKSVRGKDKIVSLRIDEVGTDDASSITSSPSLSPDRCNSCLNIEEVQANIINNDKRPCDTEPTLSLSDDREDDYVQTVVNIDMTSLTGVTERHNISPNRFIRQNSAPAETTDGAAELMFQSRFTSHARRLYVGRIPNIECADEVHAFFRDTIRQSIVLDPSINPNAALHKVQYVDGDPVLNVQIHRDRRFDRRYGFVEFKTVEITTTCLTLHGVTILGWGKVDVKRPKEYNITLAQKYNITEIPRLDFSRLLGTPNSTILDEPNKIIVNNLTRQLDDCQIMEEEHAKKEDDAGISSTACEELHDSSNLTPESPLPNLGFPYDTDDEFDKGSKDFNCVVKDDTGQQVQSLYTKTKMPVKRFRSKSWGTLKSKSISWASICSESDSDSEFGDDDCTVEATKNLAGIRTMEEKIIIFKDDDTVKNNVRQTSDSSASCLSLLGGSDNRVTDLTDQVTMNDTTKSNWSTVSNKNMNFRRMNSCPSVLDSPSRQSLSPNKYTPPHLRFKTEESLGA